MIERSRAFPLKAAIAHHSCAPVVVLGLRQAGKTTLGVEVGQEFNTLYLNLESWMGSQVSAQR